VHKVVVAFDRYIMASHVRKASETYMKRELTFLLGTLAGGLSLASLGTFLWYVPRVSWAAIVVTLVGMVLMFLLGIQTGAREIRAPEEPSRTVN
jgi:hypothetical protein